MKKESTPSTPADVSKPETFEDYMRNARDEFVKTITYYFPNGSPHDFEGGVSVKDIRVASENILIAYDQMREKLTAIPTDVPTEAFEALKEYNSIGTSFSAMAQRDTPRQKELICLMIEKVNGDVQNDWTGEIYENREDAKKYVMDYGRKSKAE